MQQKQNQKKNQHEQEPVSIGGTSRTSLIILVILTLLALADAVWLQIISADVSGFAKACELAEGLGCSAALMSSYGRMFGISLTVWAVGAYGIFFLISLQALVQPSKTARNLALLGVLTGASLFFVAYLVYISVTALDTYCPYCLVLHILTPIIFVTAFVAARKRKVSIVRTLIENVAVSLKSPLFVGTFILVAVLFVVGLTQFRDTAESKFLEEYSQYGKMIEGEWPRFAGIDSIVAGRPFRGDADAPVTIVEFGDFTCHTCQAAYPLMESLVNEYPVKFYYVPYARGSECNSASQSSNFPSCFGATILHFAGDRGVYWEVHDLLFEDVNQINPATSGRLTELLGIDNLQSVMNDTAAKRKVPRDVQLAHAAGAKRTPTFFVNGMGFEGAPERWYWDRLIQAEIERAQKNR